MNSSTINQIYPMSFQNNTHQTSSSSIINEKSHDSAAISRNNSRIQYHHQQQQQFNNTQTLLLKLLRPLLNTGYYAGFFPFHVDKNSSTIKHYKICGIFVFIASFLGTADFLFHFFSIWNSIIFEKRAVIDVVTQTVWITSGIVSIFINLKTLFHHEGIEEFLECWKSLEPSVAHLINQRNAFKWTKLCYFVYSLLAIISISFCVFHAIRLPAFPTYVLHYINHEGGDEGTLLPKWLIGLNIFVQSLRVAWVWVGTAMLECLATVIATFITLALKGIVIELEEAYRSQPKHNDDTNPFLELERLESQQNLKENSIRTLNASSGYNLGDSFKDNSCYTWSTCPILVSVRHYQILSELQTLVNNFIGFLLFLDLGQLILLICTLTFLPIKSIDKFDVDNTMIYCGNGFCMALRLIVLIICIGNVYPAAQSTNFEFGKIITTRYFPNQVLNPVLGHLSIYSASPICFSAWGFFAITKGTLLTSISLIITYLIVFLQINAS